MGPVVTAGGGALADASGVALAASADDEIPVGMATRASPSPADGVPVGTAARISASAAGSTAMVGAAAGVERLTSSRLHALADAGARALAVADGPGRESGPQAGAMVNDAVMTARASVLV